MPDELKVLVATPSEKRDHSSGDAELERILLLQNVVTSEELETAKKAGADHHISLRMALIGLDICLEDEINWAISRDLKIPYVLISREMIDSEVVTLFSPDTLRDVVAIPIRDALGGITIVMADPLDEQGFRLLQNQRDEELHLAVAPPERISSILKNLIFSGGSSRQKSSLSETKDSSGVADVYGLIVAARKFSANRILIRSADNGLDAIFRAERGWLPYRTWEPTFSFSVISRCRIMMGLPSTSNNTRERAKFYARIFRERILIEADFSRDSTGYNIDIHIFPVISSPSLQELKSLNDRHRSELLNLFSVRRPTGIVLVNSPDQRQRYRMIYGLLALLSERNLDVISVEEKRFLDSQKVRRYQVKNASDEWMEAIHQECEVMAIADAPYWQWRELTSEAGQKLVILGIDFANSWLAMSSFLEVIESRSVVSDRLRAIWSGKRVDLTCEKCDGKANFQDRFDSSSICPQCNGYGHSGGTDLFEVFVPDQIFRDSLMREKVLSSLHSDFELKLGHDSINAQLNEGIASGEIFDGVVYDG